MGEIQGNEVLAATTAQERDLNSTYVLTTIVLLVVVTMTFGGLIAAFLVRSQSYLNWRHLPFPPILWATTVLLIGSSISFEKARQALRSRDQYRFYRLTRWTAVLGALFLAGQIIAWLQFVHAGILMSQDPHSSFFFLFSGLHGLHIVAGLAALGYLLMRTQEPASGPRYQMKTRALSNAVSIFWHYLDLLWLALFILLLTWHR